jgi:hypothetical protein
MSDRYQCTVCDAALDPYGRDGTRCERCSRRCQICGGDVACCGHKLVAYTPMSIDLDDDGGRVAA